MGECKSDFPDEKNCDLKKKKKIPGMLCLILRAAQFGQNLVIIYQYNKETIQ